MKFKDIIDGLKYGKKYTCKRWNNEKIYIVIGHFLIYIKEKTKSVRCIILNDEKAYRAIQFTPSVENIFDDEWVEIK